MMETAHHFFITICAASGSGGMEVIMNIFRYLNAKGVKIPNHKDATKDLKVEVLEPKEARDIIRRNAEETLKIYGGLGK